MGRAQTTLTYLTPHQIVESVELFFKETAKEEVTPEEWEMLQLAREGLLARDVLMPVLAELSALKKIKDTEGKTPEYLKRQPKAWKKAEGAINQWLALRTLRPQTQSSPLVT